MGHCSGLWAGTRQQVVESWLVGDCRALASVNVWLRPNRTAIRTCLIQVPNFWLIEECLSQWQHFDHSVLSIYGRSEYRVSHKKGGFGPRFTFLIQPAGEQRLDIRICACVCLYVSNWSFWSTDRFILCVCMNSFYLLIISLAKDSRVSEWRNQGWDGKNRVCQASVQLH